ncbi:MAG: type VI secretion system contractile sheath large subunit, partial [Acetobacteraceae bacterium]
MSGTETAAAGAAASTTEAVNILDQVVAATKQTEPDRAQELVKTLVEQALSGTVIFDRNLTRTFERAIAAIDRKLSAQLNEVMHHPKFLQLEGTWRGLNHLVMNSETGTSLKINVMNMPKRELTRDLTRAVEFDQSQLFKKIYENEFGTPGGEPYGTLIGDYEWTQHPDDVETLRLVSNVSAAAFAPFISAAGAGMFGFKDWTELSKPRDLAKIFDTQEYAKWRSYRDSEDSRFVNLVMPRVIARLPYGSATKPIEEFNYEEAPYDAAGAARPLDHQQYCWMNAAYVMGTRLTDAFAKYGFCVAIRGAEGGGKVENLPTHVFTSDDGDLDTQCPTEIGITDRREFELSNQGFLPLCHYKNTDYAVFFGAQSTQKPKKYDRPEATANAAISARMPYIMASSRFAHYLKVLARDKIGSFMEASNCEQWLNRWIKNYVNSNENAGPET